jgi:hypothetical protein
MSDTPGCSSCCEDPVVTQVPGTSGEDGTAGSNGADGVSAFTLTAGTAGPFDKGDTTTVSVGSTAMLFVGQVLAIEDVNDPAPGYFSVAAINSSVSVSLLYLDISANSDAATIASGKVVAPAGPSYTPGALPTAFTDNSGGTLSNAINAGVGIQTIAIPVTLAVGGTGAADALTTYIFGHAFKILGWTYVTAVAGATGLNRIFNMEINAVDVSTVVSTITLSAANTGTVGTRVDGGAVSGAQTGAAGDSFSIEVAAGGTAFTAGSGFFIVSVQNLDTRDALASLADHTNNLITALS